MPTFILFLPFLFLSIVLRYLPGKFLKNDAHILTYIKYPYIKYLYTAKEGVENAGK
jgi:hypothetical protein